MSRASYIGSLLVVLFLFCLLFTPRVFAQPNATIINGNVHLRNSYPTFGISTLFTFRLNRGASLAIIANNTRVRVLSKRIIANKYEWFEVIYNRDETQLRGWIYGGEVGNRRYIRLDPGVEQQLPIASTNSVYILPNIKNSSTIFLFRNAYAQSENVVNEPIVKTDPISTLLFGACYVIIFLAALFITKKWIFVNSNLYSFLTSLCVLLILGFISDTFLSNVITQLLIPK